MSESVFVVHCRFEFSEFAVLFMWPEFDPDPDEVFIISKKVDFPYVLFGPTVHDHHRCPVSYDCSWEFFDVDLVVELCVSAL